MSSTGSTGAVAVAKGSLVTLVIAAASMSLAAVPGIAQASPAQPTVVSQTPASFTPNVQSDSTVSHPDVYVLRPSGAMMYAGGTFHTVADAARTTTFTRSNIMGFDASTGAVSTSFAPTVNGAVWAIEASGSSLYVGGTFTSVNGAPNTRGLAKLDATTGAVDPAFVPPIPYGVVTDLRMVGSRLFVGGTFPKRLAALDPATGADTRYINLQITGSVTSNAGPTQVYKFAVTPAGDRLVGVGNFTAVGGQARQRAFMLTLDPAGASVNPWYYAPLNRMCRAASHPDYVKGVDFSPDGSYFVFASTGWVPATTSDIGTSLCDAAARFETYNTAPTAPTWINYTGGDSLYAVAVTGSAVYVQGHQRWLDNPQGTDFAGPGAVSRPGIGAIDPQTGRALPWNPTKTRGNGGKTLTVTPAGLWVASDGTFFNGKYHYGIAFCPLP